MRDFEQNAPRVKIALTFAQFLKVSCSGFVKKERMTSAFSKQPYECHYVLAKTQKSDHLVLMTMI